MPLTSAPSTTSPSLRATRSMTTKSPSAAARSTSVRLAKRSRRFCTCSSTSWSVTATSSTRDLEAGVVGQLDLGTDVDLGGELEGLVVLELGDVDLRLGQRLEVVGLQRLDVQLGQRLVDRLVEHGAAADLTVDDHRRDLAAAEAGHVDLLGDLLVRRVEARLELLEGHLDGELGPGRAQSLDGALHRWFSSVNLAGRWAGGVSRRARGQRWSGVETCATRWSGRQDSNLRSPAPKAGALATTLRPGFRPPVSRLRSREPPGVYGRGARRTVIARRPSTGVGRV